MQFSALKIRARHHLILPSIGAYKSEQDSYELATSLLYSLPCVVIVFALFDQILIIIYMLKVHPWRGIVLSVGTKDEENRQTGNFEESVQLTELNAAFSEENMESGNDLK